MADESSEDFIRKETEALFRELLGKARHILKAGTVQNQITLIRQVIPVLMKEMQAQKESDENAETEQMLTDLFAEVRSSLTPDAPPTLPDDV